MINTCAIEAKMNKENSNGFFFPAIAGLFFFLNQSKSKNIYKTEANYPVYTADESGKTGVAKYLDHQNALLLTEISESDQTLQPLSGVEKYLEGLDKAPTSGVSKYVLRQNIAEKQKNQLLGIPEATGVEKYLKTLKPTPELSGVAKYLKAQANQPQPSNVAKYLAKQAAISALTPKTVKPSLSGVAKYLEIQESLPQPSRVARYMAKQEAISALAAKLVIPEVALTGVAKYLDEQAKQPQLSNVAKYMARQALNERKQPAVIETSVAKYMRLQA